MTRASNYSARDLARWGLLAGVRKEAARDQLMAAVGMPSQPELEVLLSQWAQQQGIRSQAMVSAWLAHNDLNLEELQALVARRWRWQQWCEREAGSKVASRFLARKAALDQVSFWRLHTVDGDLAAELYLQLREGESSFAQLTQQSLAGGQQGPQAPPWQVALAGPLALEQLPGELAGLLRVSEVGVLWPPRAAAEGGWQLLQLEQRIPAVLDGPMRQRLLEEIGDLALEQMLQASPVAIASESHC